MKFLKTCYSCGKKTNELYESMCEECYKLKYPPIKELKPLNLKMCNSCKKIHYDNQFLTIEEIENILPQIILKNIELNKSYIFKKIEVENFINEKNRINFDFNIEVELEK